MFVKFLLFFSILLLQIPAFSNDFSGTTWALTGVGCRDGSLSERSHVSKSLTSGDVTAGIIHFIDDNRFNMTQTLKGEEQTLSGAYRVNRESITFGLGARAKTIPIVGRELIFVGSKHDSVKECCPAKHVGDWRDYKRYIQEGGPTSDHSRGTTWEKKKAEEGWDEEWMAESEEEFERLREKCQREKPFVYVLEEV